MSTTNAELGAQLARIESELHHIRSILGDEPDKGLRGEVSELTNLKNKGRGFIGAMVLVAGGAGAALKSSLEALK